MYGGSNGGAALLVVDATAPGSPYRPAMVSAANVAINEGGQPIVLSMPPAAGSFELRYFYVASLSGPIVLFVTGSRDGVPTGPPEQITLEPAQPRQLVLLPAATFGNVDSVTFTPVDPAANGTYSNSTTLFGIDNMSLAVTLAPDSPPPEAVPSPPPSSLPPPDSPPPEEVASPPLDAPPPAVLASPPPKLPPPVVPASPPPAQTNVGGGAVLPPSGQTPQQQPPPPGEPTLPPPAALLSPPPPVSRPPPPTASPSPPPVALPPPAVVASPPPVAPPPSPPLEGQNPPQGFDNGSVQPGEPVPEGYGGNPGVSYGNDSNPDARGQFVGANAGPGGSAEGAANSGNTGDIKLPTADHIAQHDFQVAPVGS